MGKSSLLGIPKDHFRTLRDARDNSLDVGGVLLQIGLPVILAAVSLCRGWKLTSATGVVTGVSIVAALLCSMAVFIFQLRIEMVNDRRLTTDDFDLVNESFHNVMWAILVGLTVALLLVVAEAAGGLATPKWDTALTAITILLSSHFLIVIAMCMKRLRRAFERVAMRRE